MALEPMKMTDRIRRLRNRILAEPGYVSIEQARIFTRVYREHEQEPRILVRAMALRAALTEMAISIDPEELIVGNCTAGIGAGAIFPERASGRADKAAGTLSASAQDTFEMHEEDSREFREDILPYWKGKSLADELKRRCGKEISSISQVVKLHPMDTAQGSICPNCAKWLSMGPAGLRHEAEAHFNYVQEKELLEFYHAVSITMEGVQTFMQRYARLAWEMTRTQNLSAKRKRDLLQVAANCEALAERPPGNFYEAVQSLWFLFVILQMESNASSFSPGRLDFFLRPYYDGGVSSGRLDAQQALEILECLWLKFNQVFYVQMQGSAKGFNGVPVDFHVVVGGQDAHGEDFVNELSYLCLKAQEQLRLPQPHLSVRLHENTGRGLLKLAVRGAVKGNVLQFLNDKAAISALQELGVYDRDACNYAVADCAAPIPQGRCLDGNGEATFHLHKALELALNGGRSLPDGKKLGRDYGSLTDYEVYGDLEEALRRQLDDFMARMARTCHQMEKVKKELFPMPFLSAVTDDGLIRGMDVTQGGARYNFSGIRMAQIENLADSLAAIKHLVYDEKSVSREELLCALRDDFEGHEELRARLLHQVAKYRNGADWVVAIGAKWAKYFHARLGTYTNYRGGSYRTGMYAMSAHVPMGGDAGVSSDGRKAGTLLTDGRIRVFCREDITGAAEDLKSIAKQDKALLANALISVEFPPGRIETGEGIEEAAALLRTFVELGLPHLRLRVERGAAPRKRRPIYLEQKCIRCGACVQESERGGITWREDGGICLHAEQAEDWSSILAICPAGALAWDAPEDDKG